MFPQKREKIIFFNNISFVKPLKSTNFYRLFFKQSLDFFVFLGINLPDNIISVEKYNKKHAEKKCYPKIYKKRMYVL